ncbi:MAG: PilZ domain-containing protein [Deltaproteobacteria bacterium]|nr:MAG: PilZ domain-containing protein [Deltaproteobacteria bacterium]
MTTTWNGTGEKRRHERLSARDGIIVALMPHSNILGPMIDISIGGLSFQYIENAEPTVRSSELIILIANQNFFLDRVSFKIVSDIEIEKNISFSSIHMRRRGVEFVNLSFHQATLIQHLITKHTIITTKRTSQLSNYNQKQIDTLLRQL